MVAPWAILPLLAQPQLTGPLQIATFAIGFLLIAAAVILIIWAMPHIFPAASKGGDELDPEFLVEKGPYHWVRHPLYPAAVAAII